MTSVQHFRGGSSWFGFGPAFRWVCVILALGALAAFDACARKPAAPPDGAALFSQKCAGCHRPDNDMRAPAPEALHQMSKTAILTALESGRMKWEGKLLSEAKKNAIADYLAAPAATAIAGNNGYCARDLDPPAKSS